MAKKWIINDGDLIIGDAEFHEDLIPTGRKRSNTVGGGRWHFDKVKNIIYFWGKSGDFGQATKKQFDDSFKQPSIEKAEIVFSHEKDLLKILMQNCNKSK